MEELWEQCSHFSSAPQVVPLLAMLHVHRMFRWEHLLELVLVQLLVLLLELLPCLTWLCKFVGINSGQTSLWIGRAHV